MRQLRVPLKRGLIHPFRMNREHQRLPQRLEYMNRQTTCLCPRRLDHAQQLLPKLLFFTRPRFKPDENVNRQNPTSRNNQYASENHHEIAESRVPAGPILDA